MYQLDTWNCELVMLYLWTSLFKIRDVSDDNTAVSDVERVCEVVKIVIKLLHQ